MQDKRWSWTLCWSEGPPWTNEMKLLVFMLKHRRMEDQAYGGRRAVRVPMKCTEGRQGKAPVRIIFNGGGVICNKSYGGGPGWCLWLTSWCWPYPRPFGSHRKSMGRYQHTPFSEICGIQWGVHGTLVGAGKHILDGGCLLAGSIPTCRNLLGTIFT